jgi:hypothetical protein
MVVTVNVAVEAPAATVTFDGTTAAALLLARVTIAAAAALPVSVTVPCEDVPPTTEVGFNVTVARAGLTAIVMLAVAVFGVGVAESVTCAVKVKDPEAVGVPEITPAALSDMLVGKLPELTFHVKAPVPLLADKVVGGYATLTIPVGNVVVPTIKG